MFKSTWSGSPDFEKERVLSLEGKAGTSATIAMVETNKANKAPVLLKAQAKEKGKGRP